MFVSCHVCAVHDLQPRRTFDVMNSTAQVTIHKRKEKRSYGQVITFEVHYWPPEGNRKKRIKLNVPGSPFNAEDIRGIELGLSYAQEELLPKLKKAIWQNGHEALLREIYGDRKTVQEIHDELIEEYNRTHANPLKFEPIAFDKPIWKAPVITLSHDDCEAFLRSFEHLSRNTVHSYRYRLGVVLSHARKKRYMNHDPLADLRVTWGYTDGKDKDNYFSEEELRQLFSVPAPSQHCHDLLCFMIITSAGPADLVKFKYSNAFGDAEDKLLTWRRKKNEKETTISFNDLSAFLPPRVDDYLWTAEFTGAWIHGAQEHQHHVLNTITRPFNSELKEWCLEANLERNGKPHFVTSRAARRQFITQVYKGSGHDLIAAAKAAGQSTTSSTPKYIRHLDKKTAHDAKHALAALPMSVHSNGLNSAVS